MRSVLRIFRSVRPLVIVTVLMLSLTAHGIARLHWQWNALLQPARFSHDQRILTPLSPGRQAPARIPHSPADCAKTPCIALTFDDGPNPVTTPQVLDILERQRVRATFFVVGSRVDGQGWILRRMHANGHEIGNHSWNHADMTSLSPSQVMAQVNQTQTAIMAQGVPAPSLFRPPYGAVNAMVRSTVPLTLAMWNTDPIDWQTKDSNAVRDSVVHHARPGAVVDLHDIYPVTVESLEQVITTLKPGYQFVTFSEMFNINSGQRGEHFGR